MKKSAIPLQDYITGIKSGNTVMLSRAITLLESQLESHRDMANEILSAIIPHTGNSIRLGITGIPGAGKSTFIEALGTILCNQGHRLAVLAIDPSSPVTGGSLLGDKVRMQELSRHPNAFIRPSPSSGTLGGTAKRTREALLLCEAAGFDTIFIETVGVGQSEVAVRSMVDFFLLLLVSGAGDEIQGIKRGILEMADSIIINKADGNNIPMAKKTQEQYQRMLSLLQPITGHWTPSVLACSSTEKTGINEFWLILQKFICITKKTKLFAQRRSQQNVEWFNTLVHERIYENFKKQKLFEEKLSQFQQEVANGKIAASVAAQMLVQ